MLEKLEAIYARFLDIQERLSDPEVVSDMKKFSSLNKEYKDLQEITDSYLEYKDVLQNLASSQEMLQDDDEEMKEMAKEEIQSSTKIKEELEEKIKVLLIPKDPEDSKDVVMEIRSGTGGDEASILSLIHI